MKKSITDKFIVLALSTFCAFSTFAASSRDSSISDIHLSETISTGYAEHFSKIQACVNYNYLLRDGYRPFFEADTRDDSVYYIELNDEQKQAIENIIGLNSESKICFYGVNTHFYSMSGRYANNIVIHQWDVDIIPNR